MKIILDKYQEKAVKIEEKNVLVVAAPGSGKTTVIINRVNHLIEKRGVSIGNIIVITFTRAAAENMKSRYKNVFKKEITPFFGTFHGLFYKILLREGYNIKIVDGGKVHSLIKSEMYKFFDDINDDKVREVLNNISLFKTSLKSIEAFNPSISREMFEKCYIKYEEYKKSQGLWDFDDLAITTLDILQKDYNLLRKYKGFFKYVLVDEFQDCDDLQIKFLKLINEENELFAVGDEDQCIYSFRGSRPQYMIYFNETFNNGTKVYLSTNYRSVSNIIKVSKNIISKNIKRNNKEIQSFNKNDGIIKFFKPSNEQQQGSQIVEYIRELNCMEYKSNAVLYRTNMEVRSIIESLTKSNIPFVLLDKGYNFFEHFICKDIINYLKLSINIYDREAFNSIINKPFRYISKGSLSYIYGIREDKSPFDILIEKKDIPAFQCKKIDDLKKEIVYLNKISLSSAIQYIISSLGYIDYLREYSSKYNQSFNDLEDIVQEFKVAAESFKTITEFLVHVNNVKEQIEKSSVVSDGVILSTIHGVKGMEFKNVFIVNCNEETIPHKSSIEENIEEERRLFYVAITRAINNLYVFSPKTIRGKISDTSRFVLEGGFKVESYKNYYGIKKGDLIIHKTYGNGEIKDIEEDKVKIKFNDSIDRSFSLRVLMENGLMEKQM